MAKLKRVSGFPVAEGVRLDVGKYTILAVRNAEKDISLRMRREPRRLSRALERIPFARGVARLALDVARFFSGVSESAELDPQRPVKGTAPERALCGVLKAHPQSFVAWTSGLLLILIALASLYLAPQGVDYLLRARTALPRRAIRAIVCALRICALYAGVYCVGRLRVFRRLLMYKGALNQALNCYECGEPLSAESAAEYPLMARRSEAAFLLGTLTISIVLFSLLPPQGAFSGALTRLGILFGVAALFGEAHRMLEEAPLNGFVRALRAPMDWIQLMTTLAPHPQMMEVVVCAFEAALGERRSEVKSD